MIQCQSGKKYLLLVSVCCDILQLDKRMYFEYFSINIDLERVYLGSKTDV